ncbi:MAG: NEW3 domain-containing protein [Patescibacteria group bacterium]
MQRIYSRVSLFRNRRAIQRRAFLQNLKKGLHVLVITVTISNLGMLSSVIRPLTASAATLDGTISVQKQFDTNGDGVVDINGTTADPILSGWDFTVEDALAATQTQTTTDTGFLTFDVYNGTYSLQESGYSTGFHFADARCTNAAGAPVGTVDPAAFAVTGIPVNTDAISCIFINTIDTASINGQKWNDLNGNGQWDEVAPAQIGGWQVFLDTNSNGVLDAGEQTASTTNVHGPNEYNAIDDYGWYHFEDLPYGTYRVCETTVAGWNQTFPGTANGCHTVSILDPQQGDTCSPAAPEDPYNLVCDFGNQEQARITVLKNVDMNGDGDVLDAEDVVGATNWTWDLNNGNQNFATGGTQYATPGTTVTVKEDQKSGFHFTSVSCVDGRGTVQVAQNEEVSFAVATGVTYTCTYTNTKNLSTTIDKQGPATAAAGANATYTINWTVTGAPAATNVTITDPLPANTSFVSADNSGALSGSTVTWNLGTQAPGTSGTVSVTVKVNSPLANGTVLTNVATLDTDQTEPVSDTVTTTVTSAPSLSITKTHSAASFVNPGAAVTYTVVVTNAASATDSANAVVLTDVLPSGFTYTTGGTTKTFALGNIAPGASVTTTYTVTVSASQKAGSFTNTATAKGSNTSTVTATSAVEVRVPAVLGEQTPSITPTLKPTLTLTKTVSATMANPGQVVTYTMVVKNTGTLKVANVVITDTLPTGFTFLDGGKITKTWTFASIAAGASQTVTALVKIGSGVKAGTYPNTAKVSATAVDPITATATLRIAVPQVKGELAATGASASDYGIFGLGMLLLSFGFVALHDSRRKNPEVEEVK